MIVDKDNPPPIKATNTIVHGFERGLDPWHQDAFPDEFKHAGYGGVRCEGWFALDWCGNAIAFIPDGSEC